MQKKLSRFLSDLARPHVVGKDLSAGYAAMAADEARESGASHGRDRSPRPPPPVFESRRPAGVSVRKRPLW